MYTAHSQRRLIGDRLLAAERHVNLLSKKLVMWRDCETSKWGCLHRISPHANSSRAYESTEKSLQYYR